ncbi:MAG: glycosyltransferase [Candidatus Thorarchaeota archaeon]|jgi:glycosyltransferase involved in cell wall biosynthesis
MKEARISIVTTSYTIDRLKDITELLDSIQAQTYRNIETVFVADRSPELADLVRQYIDKSGYPNMRVLHNEGKQGVSSARNLAIREVKGNIVAFVDDDAILLPDWAEETVNTYYEDTSAIGVTGPILPLSDEDSMSWFPRELYWIISCTYWDMTEKTEVRNGYGTNISFRREVFDAGDLFNTALGVRGRGESGWQGPGAEEVEFSLRVKRKTSKHIIYNPRVKVSHKAYRYRFTTKFIAKRAYWEGHSKAMLNRWYNSEDGEAVLSTEREILRRILFRLVPRTFGRLFYRPLTALRRLWVVALVLSCVAGGYLDYYRLTLFSNERPYNTE